MTDDKVKEAVERVCKRATAGLSPCGSHCLESMYERCPDPNAPPTYDALQAERDKLSAEVHQVRGELNEIGGKWVAEEQARRHLEAKLTALVEACQPFAAIYAEARRDFHDGSKRPDLDLSKDAWGFNNATIKWADFHRAAQALAHHSAPVGEAAFPLSMSTTPCDDPAPPTTPTSAPVEDVGRLLPGDLEWLRSKFDWDDQRNFAEQSKLYATKYQERHGRIIAALSPALIQPQGEERS